MSKDKIQLLSPLFLKYQSDFEKNPRSRVFAPLAEAYRKLGMTDKAMEILSNGIRFHPTYTMGYLGLAFCYFDLKQFNLAYSTLRPLLETNRDNIRLQKLFSEICIELGKKEEALETLKYLLFINPRDKAVGELVQNLEKEIEERFRPNHKPIMIPSELLTEQNYDSNRGSLFDIQKLNQSKEVLENDFDDWMALDLNHEIKIEERQNIKMIPQATNYDNWNLNKASELNDSHSLKEKDSSAPLLTHTLVDLYCGQGHIEKALEVLEKILLLNPNDQKTLNKIIEIRGLIEPLEQYDLKEVDQEKESVLKPKLAELNQVEDTTEEDGRRVLMNLIDERLGPIELQDESDIKNSKRLLENKLSLFLEKIQKRALDYQSRI